MVVPWWGLIPFVIMLLSIAILPLVPATAHLWEKWRFQLTIALALGVPVALWMWIGDSPVTVGHALVEYLQFITLLFSLFVVAGGIYLKGDIPATPRTNSIFLVIGATLASFVGTTGAAMLLIRPLLNVNKEREFKVHTVVFTILMVANCGGLLTPLGDPPLFLGLLRGVPFTWTFGLWPQWLFVNGMLLVTYYLLDKRLYARESEFARAYDDQVREPLGIKGTINFLFFAMIVVGVALVPSIDLHAIESGHAAWHQIVPWREVVMLSAAAGSYLLGDSAVRYQDNEFSWAPIREVAVLFIGIFLTMMPALKFLAQVADQLPLNRVTFFVFSGSLSSVLDNAPTYATFFEMARQLTVPGAPVVAGVPGPYLVAISLGSVFCGAITYIGNGPNFMVKSVADSAGVKMPSFGGYIGWTFRYLVPVLAAMVCIFIAGGVWTFVGIALAAALLAWGAAGSRTPVVDQSPSLVD